LPFARQSFPGSSALAGAEYNSDSRVLVITFRGGGQPYTYLDVPPDTWEQLISADSPGTFWRNSIKDQFG